jgi:hypothetical protein
VNDRSLLFDLEEQLKPLSYDVDDVTSIWVRSYRKYKAFRKWLKEQGIRYRVNLMIEDKIMKENTQNKDRT